MKFISYVSNFQNNKKMKISHILVMFAMLFLLCSWGEKGHRKINGSAPLFFPARLNHYKGWSAVLSKHGSDADNRKKSDPDEGIKHFIDIDNYKDFVENQKITESREMAFGLYRRDFVMINGTLPWVTDSTYRVLVSQFRSKEWAKAVLSAADLGHYVGDGFMPLHLTANYDGKLSEQSGIHSRYESAMINRYINQIDVKFSRTRKIRNVNRYIFNYIYKNYKYKDSVLIADKFAYNIADHKYSDLYYQTLWDQTGGFTQKLIARSSKALAELIISAWTEAGKPNLPNDIDFKDFDHTNPLKL